MRRPAPLASAPPPPLSLLLLLLRRLSVLFLLLSGCGPVGPRLFGAAFSDASWSSYLEDVYTSLRVLDGQSTNRSIASHLYPAQQTSVLAYERCRATHRCPRGAAAHNVWAGSLSFTTSRFRNGVPERAALFLDFEDWRQGTLGLVLSSQ